MTEILCLSSADLERLVPLPLAIEAVKEAFVLQATGEGKLFPIVRDRLAPDAQFGIKTGFIPKLGVLGLKAGGSWKANKRKGDDTHQATVVLIDPATGRPRAFMDGNHITTIRTGAGGAVACELFAREDSKVLATIGTGVQGVIQTEAALHARPSITEVRCFNPHGSVAERFRETFQERVKLSVSASVAEAVDGADVVIAATPATQPFLFREDLAPHVHVNAVGSDTAGKREVHEDVLRAAEVFVDDLAQSRSIGELQGLDDVWAVPIGDVLRGAYPGRQKEGITVFDSTGISLQDLTTAWRAYQMALDQGIGVKLVW
jgi:ornithine cyclodeaminase/alanine dehydrogenase-like protein (mu-crystallin family)